MASTQVSSSPKPGDQINKWGYSLTWTEQHLSKAEADILRQKCDTVADAALKRLQEIRASKLEESKAKGIDSAKHNDLYAILRDHHREDQALEQLWNEVHSVPAWVDWEQIERGQKFWYRYALANMAGFALQGFFAEAAASPGAVHVLTRTGGFSTRSLLGRLLNTFQWLIQATYSLESIKPGGEAHVATVQLRLLHASVRQRILKLAQLRPDYYDVESVGVPVSTLDSMHSISTFACCHMWLQLPRFGITPRKEEIEDYIAFFRYLGYMLGTPTTPFFESADQAKRTMESMYVNELRLIESSRVLTHNLMQCVENLPFPFAISRGFMEAGCRWINGDELCDELDMKRPGIVSYLTFSGFCVLVKGLTWAQRTTLWVDELIIDFFRARMYHGIVERKSRSSFKFVHVPQLGKKTEKEDHQAHKAGSLSGSLPLPAFMAMGPIECFFLAILVLTSCGVVSCFGGMAWICNKILIGRALGVSLAA